MTKKTNELIESLTWSNPITKRAFEYVSSKETVCLFTVRLFGMNHDHFTDYFEQELHFSLKNHLCNTDGLFKMGEIKNIDLSQFIARFLTLYSTGIEEYREWYNSPIQFIIEDKHGFGKYFKRGKSFNIDTEKWEDDTD